MSMLLLRIETAVDGHVTNEFSIWLQHCNESVQGSNVRFDECVKNAALHSRRIFSELWAAEIMLEDVMILVSAVLFTDHVKFASSFDCPSV